MVRMLVNRAGEIFFFGKEVFFFKFLIKMREEKCYLFGKVYAHEKKVTKNIYFVA